MLGLFGANVSSGRLLIRWPRACLQAPRYALSSSASAPPSPSPSPSPPPPSPAPMSVVLSWAFAAPRQVSKFGDLHRRLLPRAEGGHRQGEGSVVEFTLASPHMFTFNQAAQAEAADKLLQMMRQEAGLHGRDASDAAAQIPVIVHLFSLNGYALYMHLVRRIEEGTAEPFVLKGVILDSGPGPWSWLAHLRLPFTYRNTGRVGCGRKPTWTLPPHAYLFLALTVEKWGIKKSFKDYFGIIPQVRANWKKYYPDYQSPGEHVFYHRGDFPMLFLYSQNDVIIPSRFIEGVAKAQSESGRHVDLHDFVNSGHVQHYKMHPEDYERKVGEFLRQCLAKSS